jgi:uncharacterized FlaG/YvyC family protein
MDSIKVAVKKNEVKPFSNKKEPAAKITKGKNKGKAGGLWKIFITIIITALVVGGGVYAWQNKLTQSSIDSVRQEARNARISLESEMDNLKSQLQGQETANAELKKTQDELAVQAKLLVTAQQEFKSDELGLSFTYPARLGEVKLTIENGETGKIFQGIFTDNDRLVFGGISKDFSAGREGGFTDTQGYLKKGDKYYFKFVSAKPVTDYEIKPVQIIKASNEDVLLVNKESFITETVSEGPKLNPGEDSLGALVNLRTKDFTGVAFWNRDLTKMTSADFETILETIMVEEVK